MLGITSKTKTTQQNKGVYDNSSKEIIANLAIVEKDDNPDALLYESIIYITENWYLNSSDENKFRYFRNPKSCPNRGTQFLLKKNDNGSASFCILPQECETTFYSPLDCEFETIKEKIINFEQQKGKKTILEIYENRKEKNKC